MATKARSSPAAKSASAQPAATVDAFLQALDHPLKAELQVLREILLAADASISEDIKWNAPSFRTSEFFATFNLRSRDRVQLIMHFGAKVNEISSQGVAIADPTGLLAWRGKDRAIVTFADGKQLAAARDAFTAIVRQWIVHVR